MKAVLPFFLLLAGCTASWSRSSLDVWQSLQFEALGIIAGTQACGPISLEFGFCRSDNLEVPSSKTAALSDSCRGQPVSYLAKYGLSRQDLRDRKAAADALTNLFLTPPFGGSLLGLDDRTKLKTIHDRDQALRFYRPSVDGLNPQIVEQSKWVAICAHALFARRIVGQYLARTSAKALSTDKELATHAWLLLQHSDFDPRYQLQMSKWFGSVDIQHMKRHSAYLFDRAMVGLNKPQRFGTQLRCERGTRGPFPVEDENGMDQRRILLGLAPMKEHLLSFPRPCPPRQSQS